MNYINKNYKDMAAKKKTSAIRLFLSTMTEYIFMVIAAALGLLLTGVPLIGFGIKKLLYNTRIFDIILSWFELKETDTRGYLAYFTIGFWALALLLLTILITWLIACFIINIVRMIRVTYRAAHLPLTIEEIKNAKCVDVWAFAEMLRYMTEYCPLLDDSTYISLSMDTKKKINEAFLGALKSKTAFTNSLTSDANTKTASEKKELTSYIRKLFNSYRSYPRSYSDSLSALLEFLCNHSVYACDFTEKEIQYYFKQKKETDNKKEYDSATAVFCLKYDNNKEVALVKDKGTANSYRFIYSDKNGNFYETGNC